MSRIQSLQREGHSLADTSVQRALLAAGSLPAFEAKLAEADLFPLRALGVQTLQVNLGRVCNQACAHCHVDAAPDRKESMSRETMEHCLRAAAQDSVSLIDITGGAPELNSNFRWFVESLSRLGKRIMVRCNLTVIESNPKYRDLPQFYAKHNVEVVSSLPFYAAARTDAQRGAGVFDASIRALTALNAKGYGREGSGLFLDLVYNPSGAFLPPAQASLEVQFKQELSRYSVTFNRLYCITNMPISRFLEYLQRTENYEAYMERLVQAFNPAAAQGVMCRTMISVGWDGRLYDCDFNQMLEAGLNGARHIAGIRLDSLAQREIVTGRHCFGCTAGAGSSCGGSLNAASVL